MSSNFFIWYIGDKISACDNIQSIAKVKYEISLPDIRIDIANFRLILSYVCDFYVCIIMHTKILLSVVVPVYNEWKNINIVYEALSTIHGDISSLYDMEVIFINDGSKDNSRDIIKSIAIGDPRIVGINLSRNFWHQFALSAWYEHAHGDYIISMDCDMQDPPTLIPAMLHQIEQWYDIVYARRTKRSDGFLKDRSAKIYYKILSHISHVDIPRNVWDFRIFNRQVLDVLLRCQEGDRYLRWLFAWFWFRTSFVDYERPERLEWRPSYTWRKSIKLAGDGILHFSTLPLKMGLVIWIIAIMSSSIFFVYIAYDYLINGVDYPLYKRISVVLLWFMGLQFVFMWILGEYILRIYNETKNRPLYIIQEKIQSQN